MELCEERRPLGELQNKAGFERVENSPAKKLEDLKGLHGNESLRNNENVNDVKDGVIQLGGRRDGEGANGESCSQKGKLDDSRQDVRAKTDDDAEQEGAGDAKGKPSEGPVRRRRKISLGLTSLEVFSNADNEAKYSQAEVEAKMEKFQAETAAANEKALLDLKAEYEMQMTVMQRALEASQKEAEQGRIAAKLCAEQETLTAELSEQLSEFESSNMARLEQVEKELGDKKVQLEVITQQYLSLKMQVTQLEAGKTEREKMLIEQMAELKRKVVEAEHQAKSIADELENVRNDERDKRTAAVLKMKTDMKTLAEQQFAEANKTFHIVQQQLKQVKQELDDSKKAQQREQLQAKTAIDTLTHQMEDAKKHAEQYKQALATKEADFAKREDSLTKSAAAAQAEAASKDKEVEKLRTDMTNAARDRDAAQESLARLALRNGELQKEVADLNAVSNELMEMMEKLQR